MESLCALKCIISALALALKVDRVQPTTLWVGAMAALLGSLRITSSEYFSYIFFSHSVMYEMFVSYSLQFLILHFPRSTGVETYLC